MSEFPKHKADEYGLKLYKYGKVIQELWWNNKEERDRYLHTQIKGSPHFEHVKARKVRRKK